MHTDRCGNTCSRNVLGKEAEKVKMPQFRYTDTANVELKCTVVPVIIVATGMVTESVR
jgi:hypothetical protein